MSIKLPSIKHIQNETEDLLGFGNAAKKISKLVAEAETPNAIGIYGPWGSGKTSLMNLIYNQIKDQEEFKKSVIPVWFNVWKHQTKPEIPILYPLLKTIEDEVSKSDLKKGLSELVKTTILFGLGAFTFFSKFVNHSGEVKPALDDMEEYKNRLYSDYEKWIINTNSFKDEFHSKLTAALKSSKKDRLIVFLDDLDRLNPDQAFDLLNDIKVFLDVPKTVFIFGLNKKVIINFVNTHFLSTYEYGAEYLDKIIPFSVDLPIANVLKLIEPYFRQIGKFTDPDIEVICKLFHRFAPNQLRTTKGIVHKLLLVLSNIDLEKVSSAFVEAYSKDYSLSEEDKKVITANAVIVSILKIILARAIDPEFFEKSDWNLTVDSTPTRSSGNERIKEVFEFGDYVTEGRESTRNPLFPGLGRNTRRFLSDLVDNCIF